MSDQASLLQPNFFGFISHPVLTSEVTLRRPRHPPIKLTRTGEFGVSVPTVFYPGTMGKGGGGGYLKGQCH